MITKEQVISICEKLMGLYGYDDFGRGWKSACEAIGEKVDNIDEYNNDNTKDNEVSNTIDELLII